MTRRGRGDRPGRKKKGIRCASCGNRLGEYHNHGLCNECVSKQDASKGMSIPKMTTAFKTEEIMTTITQKESEKKKNESLPTSTKSN